MKNYCVDGKLMLKPQRAGQTATWALCAVAGLSIAGLVVGMTGSGQAQPDQNGPQLIVSAKDLSASFREIAKQTFPGIVAIETQGRAVQVRGGMGLEDFFEGDPRFEQFFRNSPELKRFFDAPQQAPQQRRVPRGQGSGFIISAAGHIMTNNHVIDAAEVINVRLHNGKEYTAEVVGVDPRSDVAVIKIEADELQPIPLGTSQTSEVGDFVLAFGNPFGLEMTMTQGIISAKGRGPGINEREDYLQTDAAINPGNSGGPLVNLAGEVIGINTAISSRSGGYDGVGFAIPIEMARWAADQIIETGSVKRAYIGVGIQPITSVLADQLGVGVNEGAIVTQVMPDSPAAKAGLEPGDIIKRLNGDVVAGTRQLQGIVEKLTVGKSYPLLIQRDGQEQKLKIEMAEMPTSFTMAEASGEDDAESQKKPETAETSFLGMQVQALTNDLAEQFGYPENLQGVIISQVEPGSLAEQAGLQAGEVILKLNQAVISNLKDFEVASKNSDTEKGVLLLVRRGNLTRFLVIKQ